MALLGLLLWVCGGRALDRFGLPQWGAVKPLHLPRPVFQLDVRGEGGRGGGGGLQETAVVEEAEDSATLLSKGIQDETILYGRERKGQEVRDKGDELLTVCRSVIISESVVFTDWHVWGSFFFYVGNSSRQNYLTSVTITWSSSADWVFPIPMRMKDGKRRQKKTKPVKHKTLTCIVSITVHLKGTS